LPVREASVSDLTSMSALPPYLRVAEGLSIEIGAGRLRKGDKLPPERVLAEAKGVSVATLRKALKLLEDRGRIERRHGSGNYVTGLRDTQGTYALFRLERHPEGGGLPGANLISLRQAAKPDHLPPFTSGACAAWNIRRLRRLDDLPVALEDIWLEDAYDIDLSRDSLSESLYKTYRERLSLQIHRVEDRITLAPLPDWAPDTLPLPKTAQMGLVERQAFDGYGRVVEVSHTWFDPTRARYFARHP